MMNESVRDLLTGVLLKIEADIAANVGLHNAIKALISAHEQECPKTMCVLENALGLTTLRDLKLVYGLKTEEEVDGRVFEGEAYLNAFFAANFKEINKNGSAKENIGALRVIMGGAEGRA